MDGKNHIINLEVFMVAPDISGWNCSYAPPVSTDSSMKSLCNWFVHSAFGVDKCTSCSHSLVQWTRAPDDRQRKNQWNSDLQINQTSPTAGTGSEVYITHMFQKYQNVLSMVNTPLRNITCCCTAKKYVLTCVRQFRVRLSVKRTKTLANWIFQSVVHILVSVT